MGSAAEPGDVRRGIVLGAFSVPPARDSTPFLQIFSVGERRGVLLRARWKGGGGLGREGIPVFEAEGRSLLSEVFACQGFGRACRTWRAVQEGCREGGSDLFFGELFSEFFALKKNIEGSCEENSGFA